MDNTKVCVNCGKTIDQKAKVCPYCNKKQPGSKVAVIIIVSALIILLAVFAVYVKGLLDDMGMKMMKRAKNNSPSSFFLVITISNCIKST